MIKYFLYSKEQHKKRLELEKKIGRKYIPGTVMVGGEARLFTEISNKYNDRFKDTIIVYQGEESEVKFTKPKVTNLRG
jgi:hypothetical protein